MNVFIGYRVFLPCKFFVSMIDHVFFSLRNAKLAVIGFLKCFGKTGLGHVYNAFSLDSDFPAALKFFPMKTRN